MTKVKTKGNHSVVPKLKKPKVKGQHVFKKEKKKKSSSKMSKWCVTEETETLHKTQSKDLAVSKDHPVKLSRRKKKSKRIDDINGSMGAFTEKQRKNIFNTKGILDLHDSLSSKIVEKPKSIIDLPEEMVLQGVQILLKLYEEDPKKKNILIGEEEAPVFLNVSFVKVPEAELKERRLLNVQHSIHGESPSVCLIMKSVRPRDGLKRFTQDLIDYMVDYYEEYLQNHNVTNISSVIPMKQLKDEYGTYELRRHLVRQFDVFICDSRLHDSGEMTSHLGKAFIKCNKFPLVLRLPKEDEKDVNLQERINTLLNKTWFYIKECSDVATIKVGNVSMTDRQLAENVSLVLKQLPRKLPGGEANVRDICIFAKTNMKLPLYIYTGSGNEVPVPVVRRNLPKLAVPVEDEVSTQPGKIITVLPSGEILVRKKTNEEKESDFEWTESESEDEDTSSRKKNYNTADSKKKKESRKEDSGSEQDDKAIEEAEEYYMSNLSNEWMAATEQLETDREQDEGKLKTKKGTAAKKMKKMKKDGKPDREGKEGSVIKKKMKTVDKIKLSRKKQKN